MPGTPIEEKSNTISKDPPERPPNPNSEPVVWELSQTDKLNQKLLVSLLQRMNNSTGEFDKFMEKTDSAESQEENDF